MRLIGPVGSLSLLISSSYLKLFVCHLSVEFVMQLDCTFSCIVLCMCYLCGYQTCQGCLDGSLALLLHAPAALSWDLLVCQGELSRVTWQLQGLNNTATRQLHYLMQRPGGVMQYLEEPTVSLEAALEFSRATGIPVALDESLDDSLQDHAAVSLRSLLPEASAAAGVAAVVVKPAVVGGFEAASLIADWARARGIQVTNLPPAFLNMLKSVSAEEL